ncbi:MAG TPA: GDSL-type esterase/lipase family protein [Tepidisphaeraceae bacterium]|jgi:beta-glucosidase
MKHPFRFALPLVMCLCGPVLAQATMPSAAAPSTRPAPKPRTPTDAITPTTRPANPRQWMSRHDRFLQEIKDHPDIGLLFIGDSITDFWRNRGAEVWKRFEAYKPADFGISGDETQWVIWRLQNGELEGIHPKVVVIMIGTNNIGHYTDERPEWAAAGVKKIVEIVREKLPNSKILLLGVFPRDGKDSDHRKKVTAINEIISELHDGEHVVYLDIGAKFLDSNGELPKEVMPDKLHPTTQGYEIWYDAMQETLDRMMK